MYFLRWYCGMHVAETCTFGELGVHLCAENDATIEWREDGNPLFSFSGAMSKHYEKLQTSLFETARVQLEKVNSYSV
jgi:hypothetical protein